MLTQLGLSGTDVFTIKKLARHNSVQNQKERAIQRMMEEYGHIAGHGSVDVDKAPVMTRKRAVLTDLTPARNWASALVPIIAE